MRRLFPTANVNKHRTGEKGFSLVVVLFFVGLVASLVAINAASQKGAVQRDQARSAGWHLAQVAKAARIYVRNNSLEESDAYHKSKLTGNGLQITVSTLRSAGLLPPRFPDTNILGQTVRIYAANFPVAGDPDDINTVANAYVFLESTTETQANPLMMQYLIEGAKQNGLYAEAPLFNDSGASIGDDCDGDGENDYVLWDTNCLDLAEFSQITALGSFTPGSLMIPAWRAENHDTRAVMRFPQPENPGYATMLTSLEMGESYRDPSTGECTQYVQIYDYSSGDPSAMVDTDICDVYNDGGTTLADDRRFDLVNVSAMEVQSIVAANQGVSEVTKRYDVSNNPVTQTEYESVDNSSGQRTMIEGSAHTEVVTILGDLNTGGSVWATGRQPNPTSGAGYQPTVNFSNVAGGATNLAVDNNVQVDDGTGSLNMDVSGASAVETALSTTLDNDRPGSSTASVAGLTGAATITAATLSVSGGCNGAECGLVANSMDVNGAGTSVNAQTANFFNTLTAPTVSVTGTRGAVPAIVAYRGQGNGNTTVQQMTIGGTLAVDGGTSVGGQTNIDDCFGAGCPNITQDPQDGVVLE